MPTEKSGEMLMQMEKSLNIYELLVDLEKLFSITHSSFFKINHRSKIQIIAFLYA